MTELEEKEVRWEHERTYAAIISNVIQAISLFIQSYTLYFLMHHHK